MKNSILTIFVCLFTNLIIGQSITEGNNKFAINFLQKVAKSSENAFFSPYSISTALFMTAGGARNQTEKEMLDVLVQTGNSAEYHKQYGEHLALVEKKEKIQLNIANSIWMQKGFIFQKEYVDLLNNAYKAKLNECNFKANPDAEAKKINKWVEDKTKNKIKDLIKPGILKSNTKMVLVNAIYFYGGWQKEFDKKDTKENNFYQNDGTSIKANFMNAEYKMQYSQDNDFELVSIPYANKEASMLVFLPKKKGNFENDIKALDYKKYTSLIGLLNSEKVNLTFPKYTMTAEYELKQTLSEMGMPQAFSDDADFSGMTGKSDLKIDKVIHKAFIDVSEKGTEAAAATAVIMTTKSAAMDIDKIIYFKADHPFIFMIKDNATGQILFAGVVNKPGK
jgi:serpin B